MAVNAPDAGTIKEFLASEDDTVTVGQDLLRMELGGAPDAGGKQEGGQTPKAPASDGQPTSSDPKPSQSETEPKQESSSPPPPPPKQEDTHSPKQESKPSPPKKEPPPQQNSPKPTEPKKPEPKNTGGEAAYGSREERRVWPSLPFTQECWLILF